MARSRKSLGDILVEMGAVNADQVAQATKLSEGAGKRLGETIVEAGFTSEESVAKAMAKQYAMPFVDLAGKGGQDLVDMSLIPEDLAKKHLILPLGTAGNKLRLAIHDPMDLELLDMLRFRLNKELEPSLAAKSAIKGFFEAGDAAPSNQPSMVAPDESLMTDSIDSSVDKSVDKSIDVTAEDSPIVKLVNRILNEAIQMRASDIHIEPMADRVRLRYRIDGVCMERDRLPKRMQNALLSRVKLMSGVNIAERRVPQDGRIKLGQDDGSDVDFRVSSCPAYHGESVVLRILRPDAVKIGLENLGFEPDNLQVFNRIIRRPNGIFLVTGPTGSGKTTTLYSALDVLNQPDRKIITAEDPVEYNFDGINQCQVRDSIGLTFPAILRSMLRQAPNIILVGEIRDKEVAEIAIQAALTGHLVFSTLHTNDAPSAMTRLIDMGVKPFLVASSIQAIMAQRLIRVLCQQCKEVDHDPPANFLRLTGVTKEEVEAGKVSKAVGCGKCGGAGYKGRKGIYEMLLMNAAIRDLAFNRAPISELRKAALESGMRPLVGDGKIKILKGVTTPEEIARVTQTD